ncbi:hypothetical protein HQ545_06765 [Candidatus Woesearchaeota archaeon]|nr:hypothetical protein [Candidatus Woesearchaeota archaeon]
MIRNSFIFLEKIGPVSEKRLWDQGITEWGSFLDAGRLKGIAGVRKGYYDRRLIEAGKSLHGYDSSFFESCLPSSESWRLCAKISQNFWHPKNPLSKEITRSNSAL